MGSSGFRELCGDIGGLRARAPAGPWVRCLAELVPAPRRGTRPGWWLPRNWETGGRVVAVPGLWSRGRAVRPPAMWQPDGGCVWEKAFGWCQRVESNNLLPWFQHGALPLSYSGTMSSRPWGRDWWCSAGLDLAFCGDCLGRGSASPFCWGLETETQGCLLPCWGNPGVSTGCRPLVRDPSRPLGWRFDGDGSAGRPREIAITSAASRPHGNMPACSLQHPPGLTAGFFLLEYNLLLEQDESWGGGLSAAGPPGPGPSGPGSQPARTTGRGAGGTLGE